MKNYIRLAACINQQSLESPRAFQHELRGPTKRVGG
jgi:hypothetical protein